VIRFNYEVAVSARRQLQSDPQFEPTQEFTDQEGGSAQVGSDITSDGNDTLAFSGSNRNLSGAVYPHTQFEPVPVEYNETSAPSVTPTSAPTTPAPTQSTPFTGEACEFTTKLDTECIGTSLPYNTLESAASLDDCLEQCRADARCAFYNVEGGDCDFFEEKLDEVPNSDVDCVENGIPCVPTTSPTRNPTSDNTTLAPTASVVVPTPATRCNYTRFNDTLVNAQTVEETYTLVNTTEECEDICSSLSQCFAFVLEVDSGDCFFTGNFTGNETFNRVDTFVKDTDGACVVSAAPTQSPTKSPTLSPAKTEVTPAPTPEPTPNVTFGGQVGNVTLTNYTASPTFSPTATTNTTCPHDVGEQSLCFGSRVGVGGGGGFDVDTVGECLSSCSNDGNCAAANVAPNPDGTYHCDILYSVEITEGGYTDFECFEKQFENCTGVERTRSPTQTPTSFPTASDGDPDTQAPTPKPTTRPIEACSYSSINDTVCFTEEEIEEAVFFTGDIEECLELCDSYLTCRHVLLDNSSGAQVCQFWQADATIQNDVPGATCYFKDEECETATPTVTPTGSPTLAPTGFCDYLEVPYRDCTGETLGSGDVLLPLLEPDVTPCEDACTRNIIACRMFKFDSDVLTCTFFGEILTFGVPNPVVTCFSKNPSCESPAPTTTPTTLAPTHTPTDSPSASPTASPSDQPPTPPPSNVANPSAEPTGSPTNQAPTPTPTNVANPSANPSAVPTGTPPTTSDIILLLLHDSNHAMIITAIAVAAFAGGVALALVSRKFDDGEVDL